MDINILKYANKHFIYVAHILYLYCDCHTSAFFAITTLKMATWIAETFRWSIYRVFHDLWTLLQ